MSRRRKIVLGFGAALILVAAGGALAWRAIQARLGVDQPVRPRVQVQRTFREVRESEGHLDHLEDGIACTACHQTDEGRMNRPTAAACARCHAEVDVTVHEAPRAAAAASDCLTCHDFSGDRHVKPWGCVRCHADEEAATGTLVTQIELHAEVACAACHDAHGAPSLHPPDCTTCHPDESTRHGPKGLVDGAQRCLDCHSAHDTREAADRRCATCHRGKTTAPQISLAATFAGGHDKCVSCHAPHAFTRQDVEACASCHEDEAPVAAHEGCLTCHDEHDPEASAETCAGCHEDVETPPEGHDCLGCHPPHPDEPSFLSVTTDPEGVPLASISLRGENCSSCHTQPSHAGDAGCSSCHTPHRPKPAEDKRLCVRCHPNEVRLTTRTHATPGALLQGHRDCRACHVDPAHRPQLARPACATCHPQEGLTAPPGHADCGRCHDGHAGTIRRDASCVSCHEERRAGHGALASGCDTCHRPHGGNAPGPSSPPACSRCHDPEALPGLHKVAEHQLCITCHEAHEAAPRDDRRTCTDACHAGQRAHEPTAADCSSCHPFRR